MDNEKLIEDIGVEIESLERLCQDMEELTNRFNDNPDFVETRAAGSILHDFYCGVEKIFERIALQIDGKMPKGEDWHNELLMQMSRPIKGLRDAVISAELLKEFKEHMRFRHLFRHIYGFKLKWERFKNLALSLSIILNKLKKELDIFKESIEEK